MQADPSTRYIPLTSQVGGHPGVKSSEDGSRIIKTALPAEVNFYKTVLSDPHLKSLRPFLPRFYNTEPLAEDPDKESIVLENLSYTFLKPNILDIKLGTILYDENASAEKRARMEKTARETTSLDTGVRLTGFRVYNLEKNVATTKEKAYGKSLKAADLPDGVARFFPIAYEGTASEYGMSGATAETPSAAESEVGTGLPKNLLLPILESLHEDIAKIRAAVANIEMRMVGGSFLVVYEADLDRAQEGVKVWLGGDDKGNEEGGRGGGDDQPKKPGPPYVVKLIDFAHTRLAPGEGPDEGVLLGIDTVLKLLEGRVDQVKALA